MSNIYEGRTTNEAIEKGLKELNVSRKQVDVKILESEDKRSFFNILTPRVVKVELIVKEGIEKSIKKEKIDISAESEIKAEENIRKFLDEFISKLPTNDLKYEIKNEKNDIFVDVKGEDTGYLIGYRGEVLNSIQTVISNIASKSSKEKVKVLLNIGGYREKREKDLQNLAVKIAGTVVKTKKDITLEPMTAYERKIIHTKLQENERVKTFSVGEEPYRKVVVSLK